MLKTEEAEWLVATAHVFIQYNKPLKAIALLEWVLEEQVDMFDAAKNLVMAYYLAEDYKKASKLCSKVIQTTTEDNPDLYYLSVLQGLIASKLNEHSTARKLFFKFLDFRGTR